MTSTVRLPKAQRLTCGLGDNQFRSVRPDQGVSDELLKKTDVLMWWGHKKHKEVTDELVNKIDRRVREEGMGFISLHSSHFAKPYKKLMAPPAVGGNTKQTEPLRRSL